MNPTNSAALTDMVVWMNLRSVIVINYVWMPQMSRIVQVGKGLCIDWFVRMRKECSQIEA